MSKLFTKIKINTEKITDSSRNIFTDFKIHPKAFYFFTLSLVIVVGLFYLISTNGTATKGYTIMDLEDKLTQLKEENKQLKIQATELESLSRVEKVIKAYDMKIVSKADYLSSEGAVVAVK